MPRLLIVEDSATQAKKFEQVLDGIGFDLEVRHRLSDALDRLKGDEIDVVLLDLMLPDAVGLEAFEQTHAEAPQVAIVILTALNDETLAITAMQDGAQDYLVKGELTDNWLRRAVRFAYERSRRRRLANPPAKEPARPTHYIDVERGDRFTIVRFRVNRLDDPTEVPEVGEQLFALVGEGCRSMLISFANIDYVSNGALGTLVALQRRMRSASGSLRFCDLTSDVYETFAARQFHKLFDIRADEQTALSAN